MKQFKDPHSDQELQALRNLIHWACLHAGGEAATPAAVWQQKIQLTEEVKDDKKPLKSVADKSK